MEDGKEALTRDLKIIEGMATEMPEYLVSDLLYWPRMTDKSVQPTIGGFWVRQHRLQALTEKLLEDTERQRLDRAVKFFDQACSDHRWAFAQKAGLEFAARIRQWDQTLHELLEDEPPSMVYYQSDVEVRAIIEVMIGQLASMPIEAQESGLEEINKLDRQLEKKWVAGAFIWPAGWEAAYPRKRYWWLYGCFK